MSKEIKQMGKNGKPVLNFVQPSKEKVLAEIKAKHKQTRNVVRAMQRKIVSM